MSSLLEDLNEMWKEDARIDTQNLESEALRTPILHQKYLDAYNTQRAKLIKLNRDMASLKLDKQRYYRGEMTREELEDRGWTQWLHNKVLKSDMDDVLAGDKDVCNLKTKIEYIELVVESIDRIMAQIKDRTWSIKNAIDYIKFKNGA
jgi:hypothetical protein